MTPEQLNRYVREIAVKLGGEVITEADDQGSNPEIGLHLDDIDIVLTVEVV